MSQEERLQATIKRLKDNGYRITSQRKMLLEIIIRSENSSCKEIYFAGKQKDSKLGIATVYRTVQLLEELELIKKEMVVQI